MQYVSLELVALSPTGEVDALNNAITSETVIYTGTGRETAWTRIDLDRLGREITAANFKVITRAPLSLCHQAVYCRLSSGNHTITEVTANERWRVLVLKKFGV